MKVEEHPRFVGLAYLVDDGAGEVVVVSAILGGVATQHVDDAQLAKAAESATHHLGTLQLLGIDGSLLCRRQRYVLQQ